MKQQFHHRVDKVAGRDFHEHHHWDESEPPDNPEVSIECPQCQKLTWRYTQLCRCCHVDLFAWRENERRALVRTRLQRFGFALALAAGCFGLGGYVMGAPVEVFANVGAMLLGLAAVKTFDQASRA